MAVKLQDIMDLPECRTLVGADPDREVTKIFCCDLLSIAMSKAPAGCVWVTVMGNRNTLAVASLAEAACIVLAEGVSLDEGTLAKAGEEGIAVLATELPVFNIALEIHEAGGL